MKTCDYCSRENEDSAEACKECGSIEFVEPARETSSPEEIKYEPPAPDVAPDEDAAICPFCLFRNHPGREWCKQCGTPFRTSVMGPFESALAEGFMWRGLVRGRPRRWVLVVLWIGLCPWISLLSFLALDSLFAGQILAALILAASAAVPLLILYQVTKNYMSFPKVKLDE